MLQGEEGDTLFEWLVLDNGQWQHWKECVPSWEYPSKQERPKFAQLVIPTLDSVRFEKLLLLSYSVQKVRPKQTALHCCSRAPCTGVVSKAARGVFTCAP